METTTFKARIKPRSLALALLFSVVSTAILAIALYRCIRTNWINEPSIPGAIFGLAPSLYLSILYWSQMNIKRIVFSETILVHRFLGKQVECPPAGFRYLDSGIYVFNNFAIYACQLANRAELDGLFQAMAGRGLLELRPMGAADAARMKRNTVTVLSVLIPASILFFLAVSWMELAPPVLHLIELTYAIILSWCLLKQRKHRALS